MVMVHETSPPSSPPPLPRIEQDNLYLKMNRGSSRATQIVPNYQDFCLGHGDPLLQAKIKHDFEMASPRSKKKMIQNLNDKEGIHLMEILSPVSGMGFNDIVHVDKNTILSIPCLPTDNEKEDPKKHELHTSPFGFNDIVHFPDGTVLSVPIIPSLERDASSS